MFRLDRHIEILLLRHDCVIVPGFGGFVTHHVSAHLDETDGTMLPPKVMVGFNQKLTLNDSLLVQSYVEAYDYSYPEALRILEDEVAQLQAMIQEQGHFDFHAIGRLSINRNGFYEFEPVTAGILSPMMYGFSGISTNDDEFFITREEAKERMEVAKYNRYVGDSGDERFIRISTTSLRRVMVACIVILFLMVIPFMHRSGNSHQLMSGIDTSLLRSLMHKAEKTTYHLPAAKLTTSTAKPATDTVAKTAQPTPAPKALEKAKPAEQAKAAPAENKAFAVVLAARISLRNAQSYAEDLQNRGIKDARVVGEGKSRKVVCGRYSTREDAQNMKNKLSNDEEFASSWVTKI